MAFNLFVAETTNTDSPIITPSRSVTEFMFVAQGTWGGATCTLSFSVDGGTNYIPFGASSTLTADGYAVVKVPESSDLRIKATISGVTTTSISAGIFPV